MSHIFTYTREGFDARTLSASAPVFVVGQGAGGPHWHRAHPVTQLALSYVPVVYSLQLPLHGTGARKEVPQLHGTHEEELQYLRACLDDLYQQLVPLVRNRYVVFIGYSSSGLTFTKLFSRLHREAHLQPHSLVITIGAGMIIGAREPFIQNFWLPSTYEADPQKVATMRAIHRQADTPKDVIDDASWRNCVRFSSRWGGMRDSPVLMTPDERVELFRTPLYTYDERQQHARTGDRLDEDAQYAFFVHGDADEPFPIDESLRDVWHPLSERFGRDLTRERLTVISNAGHFGYFTPATKGNGGQLETVLQQIRSLIDTYAERELLQPFRQASMPATETSTTPGATASQPRAKL